MKKVVVGIIIGILISSVVHAAISLTSDKISYKDTTVKDSLDNLFTESVNGKNNITNALSNKGFNVQNSSTYTDIVNGINELPVTIGKDNDGNYGYYKNDDTEDFISFDGDLDLELLWTNPTPTSIYDGGTITLDMSDYDYVFVTSRYRTDIDGSFSTSVIKKNEYGTICAMTTTNYIVCRYAKLTDYGVDVAAKAYLLGVDTYAYNNQCIPYQIFGVKGLASN